jgi:hypothetical protein
MQPLEEAILRTILYADVFNFPMRIEEIHHFLLTSISVSQTQVIQQIKESPLLRQHLEPGHVPYYVLRGRSELIPIRDERERASLKLWPQAVYWGRWLARLPFVRMVAITGALAVRNAAHDDDDLDFILVTQANRVWMARGLAILLVRIGKLRGVTICPNYVVAETNLAQSRRDTFMAHEVAQMIPVHGWNTYEAFRAENQWVEEQLANAEVPFYHEAEPDFSRLENVLKKMGEFLLGGRLGDSIERWEYQRKLKRFQQDTTIPHSAAQLDAQHVKGHFNDHGHPVLVKFEQRLRQMGLSQEVLARTGD